MKKIYTGLCLLLVAAVSCHRESNKVDNYSYEDSTVFRRAEKNFGEMFKIVWKGLNSNYSLWDYEKENGLDWDEVYDKYYPRFRGLDSLDTVADEDLKKLMEEAFGGLHDGHLAIQMKNYNTGNNIMVLPNTLRTKAERGEEYEIVTGFKPNLSYYAGIPGELLEYKPVTSVTDLETPYKWVESQILALSMKTVLTEEELRLQNTYIELLKDFQDVIHKADAESINRIVFKYAHLGIPGLDYVDQGLFDNGVYVNYALFKGNIAYFSFNSFKLSAFLDDDYFKEMWPNASQSSLSHIAKVQEAWNSWFFAIQRLHNEGTLGGVIIDVRTNGGGLINDYQYVMGALLPSGGFSPMNSRFKRGTGRYDYSPVMPQYFQTYPYEHVTVTEPIVVLANCKSVSMAEITSISTKSIDNAVLIGTRTYGGLCSLTANTEYNYNYSGHIGIRGNTPVYCYIPTIASITKDGKFLDGIGITPDIEVKFDNDAWAEGTGPDTQLDRALEYIRTGK